MRTFGVDAALRSEMMARMNGGWNLVSRESDRLTMARLVMPPWWRMALEFINPAVWLLGGPSYPEVLRVLHVWVDTDGVLQRRTTGAIPPSWRRQFAWEVADGPVPPRRPTRS